MASIISGFEYDIFISYRHNDNRSGWVTDFVNALQEELAATVKDPLSIYFDKNPHDGLLETHNVDKSLEGKLKCLIFIPIISQTYCDPKSFAWQHEFCAFNKLSKEDHYGRNIKLNNGNVASRILPIKIHDLDATDKINIERELAEALRAIDFIYKEPGVNRPLKTNDNKSENQNKTDYRNQVNKLANAIKEILTAIKHPKPEQFLSRDFVPISTTSNSKKKAIIISGTSLLVLVLMIYFFLTRYLSVDHPSSEIDKSIAVLPFVNMSGDKEQEYFSDGLSEELLNLLSRVPDLKVIARTSSFAFKGSQEDIRSIGEKLGVAHILEGSVRQSGDKVRITAQLIRTKDGIHLWSNTYDRKLDDILTVQDEIAAAIVRALSSTFNDEKFKNQTNPEAHRLVMQADYYWDLGDSVSRLKAVDNYENAYRLDSLNAEMIANLAALYYRLQNPKAHTLAIRALTLDPENFNANWIMGLLKIQTWDWTQADWYLAKAINLNPIGGAQLTMFRNAERLGKSSEALRIANEAIKINPYGRINRYYYTILLIHQGKFDEALINAKRLKEQESPTWPYEIPAEIYLIQGKPELAWKEVIQIPSEHKAYAFFSCLTYWSLQQKKQANEELKKYMDRFKNSSAFSIAEIYAWRGENQEALKWLDIAFQRRESDLNNINTSTWLSSLRNDPDFQNVLKKMNLPLLK